jgi:hypothetical protein
MHRVFGFKLRLFVQVRGVLRRWVKALHGRAVYLKMLEMEERRKMSAAAAAVQSQWRCAAAAAPNRDRMHTPSTFPRDACNVHTTLAMTHNVQLGL